MPWKYPADKFCMFDSVNQSKNYQYLRKEGGFPSDSVGKESACNTGDAGRREFDLWVRKISWRREMQPTLVFLPGESYGQTSLVGYSP